MRNLLSRNLLLIFFLIVLVIGLKLIFSSLSISNEIGYNTMNKYGGTMDTNSYNRLINNNAASFRIGGLALSLIGGFGVIYNLKDSKI